MEAFEFDPDGFVPAVRQKDDVDEMSLPTMSRRLVLAGVSVVGMALLLGCQTDNVPIDRSGMLPANDRVSDIPGNPPQGWENKSQLGALANDPRIGGQQ